MRSVTKVANLGLVQTEKFRDMSRSIDYVKSSRLLHFATVRDLKMRIPQE